MEGVVVRALGDDLDVEAFPLVVIVVGVGVVVVHAGAVPVVFVKLHVPLRAGEYGGHGEGIVERWAFYYAKVVSRRR